MTPEEQFEKWWAMNIVELRPADSLTKMVKHNCKIAFLAALPQWRDIETAPRDGREVLAWRDTWKRPLFVWWDDGEQNACRWRAATCEISEPTQWLDIPYPPEHAEG